jgi:prepilin-type N-terminal cleavage/methylation domain-containing protein
MRSTAREDGFSIIEMLAALGIIGIMAAMTVPAATRTVGDLRLRGDARALHNLVGLAKMRAASKFTRERLYVDLNTESFVLQYWDKVAGAWVNEGGITALSRAVDFGFDTLAGPPPSTQDALGQAPACLVALDNGAPIANTACVVFNSRGIPINSTGGPDGNGAFYITDHETGVYAITVSATPLVRLWWTPHSQTSWVHK